MQNSIDKSNFRQVILNFPDQFTKALEFSKNIKQEGDFDNVILCGMGGSAMPGALVDTFLDSKLPIYISQDYELPKETNEKSLMLSSSYSGTTEETLEALEKGIKRGLKIVGFAKGAKLEEICKKNNIPFVKYPDDGPNFQPRCAIGYSFTAVTNVLSNCGLVEKEKIEEIKKLPEFLKALNYEDKTKNLAKELIGKIPVIYTTQKFKEIARIFKIELNENAKSMAFWNYFPELNHNEMIGYTNSRKQGKFYVIILIDKDAYTRNLKRIEITSKLLEEKGQKVFKYEMEGKSVLEKMFSTLLFGLWLSYYLALEYNQDPTPVNMVERLKKMLK